MLSTADSRRFARADMRTVALAGCSGALALVGFITGCGCQCPDAKTPSEQSSPPAEAPQAAPKVAASAPVAAPPATPPLEATPKEEVVAPAEPATSSVVEPHFTPGMSVSEALAAVPPGVEFVGIDRETLGKPLSEPKLYQPCKLLASQHFTLRVAVWDGKAVGIDVTSKSKSLSDCVKQQVSQVEWPDKVKAINTIDFTY